MRASSRSSLRHCEQYSRHAAQITGNHCQLELVINPPQAAIHYLSNASDGLSPAEMLFDARPDSLADLIAAIPRRAPIDGTAAPARFIMRHMRRDLSCPAIGTEIARVVGLVGTHRLRMLACVQSSSRSALTRSPIPSA